MMAMRCVAAAATIVCLSAHSKPDGATTAPRSPSRAISAKAASMSSALLDHATPCGCGTLKGFRHHWREGRTGTDECRHPRLPVQRLGEQLKVLGDKLERLARHAGEITSRPGQACGQLLGSATQTHNRNGGRDLQCGGGKLIAGGYEHLGARLQQLLRKPGPSLEASRRVAHVEHQVLPLVVAEVGKDRADHREVPAGDFLAGHRKPPD